jgi:hypothetical protein
MVRGNITRTLKLRLKETESRNLNHSKHFGAPNCRLKILKMA